MTRARTTLNCGQCAVRRRGGAFLERASPPLSFPEHGAAGGGKIPLRSVIFPVASLAPATVRHAVATAQGGLALQLSFFEVSALSGSLVSSAPERPCDDVRGLNALLSESGGDAADFLD